MADIVDINDVREFKRILLSDGSIIDGVELTSDENFYSYVEEGVSIVKCLESGLDTDKWDDLLEGAKLVRISDMDHEFQEFLKIGFEYPVSSGNWFSLNESSRGYLVNLVVSSASLTYPVIYTGLGESSVSLADVTAVNAFYGAGLTAHETERATRELVAITAIKAVTGDPITNETIDSVFNIVY